MPSKFAVFTAAGRLVRALACWLEPEPEPPHSSGFELPYWAFKKAEGEPAPRWHDLRKTWDRESDDQESAA